MSTIEDSADAVYSSGENFKGESRGSKILKGDQLSPDSFNKLSPDSKEKYNAEVENVVDLSRLSPDSLRMLSPE